MSKDNYNYNNNRKNKDKRENDKIIKKHITVPLGIKGQTTIMSQKIIIPPTSSGREINRDRVTIPKDNRYGEIPIINNLPPPGVRK